MQRSSAGLKTETLVLLLLHPPAGNCVRREGEERGERGEEKSGVG